MKPFSSKTIYIGWLILGGLMLLASALGKSLFAFEPIVLVWLVFTIIHWRRSSCACQKAAKDASNSETQN